MNQINLISLVINWMNLVSLIDQIVCQCRMYSEDKQGMYSAKDFVYKIESTIVHMSEILFKNSFRYYIKILNLGILYGQASNQYQYGELTMVLFCMRGYIKSRCPAQSGKQLVSIRLKKLGLFMMIVLTGQGMCIIFFQEVMLGQVNCTKSRFLVKVSKQLVSIQLGKISSMRNNYFDRPKVVNYFL